jgi:hypothetical protein
MARWTPWLAVALSAGLAACTRTDTARQERRQVTETVTVVGTLAGLTVDLRTEATRQESVIGTEQTTTDAPALAALAQALPGASALAAPAVLGPGVVAAGGGVLGPLAGILGLGAAALAWWRGRQATGSLGRVIAGIEQAKAALPAPAVDTLHGALSRRLDASDKAQIRRVKAHLP